MDQGHDDNDEEQQKIYNQRGYEFPGRPIVTILNILQAPVAGKLTPKCYSMFHNFLVKGISSYKVTSILIIIT